MQIKSKVYYEVSTGNVLLSTPEFESSNYISDNTKEHDMSFYEQLRKYKVDEIDYIELDFGKFKDIINDDTIKSYNINLNTKQLDYKYFTQEEINLNQNKIQGVEALNNSVFNISEYLKLNSTNITDIEDYIIQQEQNKILGEM